MPKAAAPTAAAAHSRWLFGCDTCRESCSIWNTPAVRSPPSPPTSWIVQRTAPRRRRGSVPSGFDIAQLRLHLSLGPYSRGRPVR
ncbi:hypothetical protein MTO96_019939 [Rhipicephalus appendiculatus]